MLRTENYTFSYIFVTLLASAALIFGSNVFLTALLYGFIMIMLTIRSLSDNEGLLQKTAAFVLYAAFSAVAGFFPTFLVFRGVSRNKLLKTTLPPCTYAVFLLIMYDRTLSRSMIEVILLAAVSSLITWLETLIEGYFAIKSNAAHSVRNSALGEMYNKKLNQELVIKNYLTDRNARLEERENISRSIHNSVGHSITAAIMTLDAADMLFDNSPEKAHEKMNAANDRIRTSLDSIRHAVRVLDSEARFVSLSDLITELTNAAEGFMMDTMRKVHIDVSKPDEEVYIPHEHTEFLTGAAQELLSNGVRHGSADRFFIYITADSSHIKLAVNDNGSSDFSEKNSSERIRSGFGLKKLIAYAQRCGGNAVFTNENGFKAEITLPFDGGLNGTAQSIAR